MEYQRNDFMPADYRAHRSLVDHHTLRLLPNMQIIAIVLLASSLPALARSSRVSTEAEMRDASDLIVIGTVQKMKDLQETSNLNHLTHQFRGVETTFAISK